ncbi:MAG: 5'-nucleotidase, lipoprotein e(P4) family [Salinicola sp.]|uniref:5'-nucleotidase, lipoprotein e(P4) family n=1 Tax=uncultured Salinicola sp. TaxID=1193542 RepID=UPI000C95AC47|nr:5'-nucleotidase, lipoprotein e(P4) family [uncultured Salinicola sp.]MAM59683.1 5'-nucleotidase, lipoprotein e(P4) family [Salinicola sp.]
MPRSSLPPILLSLALTGGLAACAQQPAQPPAPRVSLADELVMATVWMQSSGEYAALSHQAFNLARMNLDRALAAPGSQTQRPPAIIVDVDETVLDNSPYEAWLIANDENYASDSWHQWVEKASAVPMPGAKSFLDYAASRGVEIFYVTNRRDNETEATLRNLRQVGFPDADGEHFLPRTDSSDKTARRLRVAQSHWVVLLMGDNLGDFSQGFDRESAAARRAAVNAQADAFGSRYIVLPNPAYGAWEEAIYGGDWSLSDEQKSRARRNHLEVWGGPTP